MKDGTFGVIGLARSLWAVSSSKPLKVNELIGVLTWRKTVMALRQMLPGQGRTSHVITVVQGSEKLASPGRYHALVRK